ncbi:MAG: tyrosine-type recombinase/integrase [Proteobacteria bacterium]|nr:tyrosine-type recombinase/integrase [Pseudomonadota bacterium]MBU1742745.1 tyrosine-type recombinase/integrase [Pseudomonadota bacterium]
MAGRILSKQRCRTCGLGYLTLGRYQGRDALLCGCGHPATRHLIRFKYKGQELNITKDRQGRPLTTFDHAQRELEGIRREIDQHTFDPVNYSPSKLKPFLAEHYFQSWLDNQRELCDLGEIAPATLNSRKAHVRRWIAFFEGTDIRDIYYGRMEDFRNHLLKVYSPQTVQVVLSALKTCLRWAKRRQELPGDVPDVPPVKVNPVPIEWIDEETQEKILAEIPVYHRPIFHFLVTYGRRVSEARALKWDCVKYPARPYPEDPQEWGSIMIRRTFSGNSLMERTKGRTLTPLPLPPHFEAVLRNHESVLRRTGRLATGFVFVNQNGRPYQAAQLRRVWAMACELVGVKITLKNGTRHSWFTQRVREGHPDGIISEAGGHADTRMIQRYKGADTTRLIRLYTGKNVIPFPSQDKG